MTRFQIGRTSSLCATLFAAILLLATAAVGVAEEPTVLRGRVLLPDGKPAAGADLYWPHAGSAPPKTAKEIEYQKRGVSDAQGRFEIARSKNDMPTPDLALCLVAHKPGFGIDWYKVESGETPAEITLRLVEDRPIRGRVTDGEGRPIEGADLSVSTVRASRDGSLDAFLTAYKRGSHDAWTKLEHGWNVPLESILRARSDRDGRFQISGIGAERVAVVGIVAPGCAADRLHVVSRAGFDAGPYNEITRANLPPVTREARLYMRLAAAELDYVAEPELVVQGKVFVASDSLSPSPGKGDDSQSERRRLPVVGATVRGWGIGGQQQITVTSDEEGRYTLHGLPRDRRPLVNVEPSPASGLLQRTLDAAAAPGRPVVEVDVELKRGLVVEGRVFDRATDRGLKGGVSYAPLPGNDFVKQPGFDGLSRSPESTDEEGRFRLLIVPGPGVLLGHAYGGGVRIDGHEIELYRQASLTDDDRKRILPTEDGDHRYFTRDDGSIQSLEAENAAKFIDLPPNAATFRCDLPVDAGKTVQIAIEDQEGQPVRNAFVSGLADMWRYTFRISEATCTIYALGADRPRRVCILHPERHLAASLTLTGDEEGPVKVRLGAPATITGRALDASGEPIADAFVQVNYARKNARELNRFVNVDHPAVKTDDDGRFHVDNIVPGERFALDFRQELVFFRAKLTDEQRQLKAGQKLELGDMTMKRL